MAITSLPFVLNQFENEKYRYFIVRDEDGDIVLAQNDVIDAAAAVQKLRSFFGNNFGTFTIEIFPQKLTSIRNMAEHDRKRITKYKVDVTQEVLPGGVGGLTGMGAMYGSGGYGALPPDDPRSNAPNMFQVLGQLSSVEQQMRLMEKDHQHWREMKELQDKLAKMEEEHSKARGMGAIVDRLGEQFSDPQVLLGLISGVSQLFNRQPQHVTPMNGLGTEIDQQVEQNIHSMQTVKTPQTAQSNDRQVKVVEAVNQLIQHDPAFPENIAKLAELAKRNPGIYKMAVQYLKTL